MTAMLIIGVDPGQKGGAVPLVNGEVILHPDGRPVAVAFDRLDERQRVQRLAALCGALRQRGLRVGKPAAVVVEQIAINYHGPNRSGHAAVIEDAGRLVGVLGDAWGWPVERHLAGAWLGDVALPGERDTKARALAAARWWWPRCSWLATDRSRVPHDGLIDAALLALSAWLDRQHGARWAVERNGDGKRWRRRPKEGSALGAFHARWLYQTEASNAKRGGVRLLRIDDTSTTTIEETTR